MNTSIIKWNEGDGNIVATFSGSNNDSIFFNSDVPNEGIDREQSVVVQTLNNEKRVNVVVKQVGMREIFSGSDEDFYPADGGTFNSIKDEF